MEEKTKYLEWSEQSATHNGKLRHAAITWAAALSLLLTTSCDSWRNDPIRQQERTARHEQELIEVSYQLAQKIEARKPFVEKYNDLLAKCEAEPDNIALKKHTSQVYGTIIDYNKDIEKLAKRKLKNTVRLDGDMVNSQSWVMVSWRHVTDASYYDFLLD